MNKNTLSAAATLANYSPADSIEAEADRLTREAFAVPRTPRSMAYREGVKAAILGRLRGAPGSVPMDRYAPASTEFDAYASGIDEGNAIMRKRARGEG